MQKGCFVNIDTDLFGYMWHGCHGDFSNLGQKLELYIEGYKNHGITDLLFNTFSQSSFVPIDCVGFAADKYYLTEENGIAVDYKDTTGLKSLHEAYSQLDDPFGYAMDVAKKCGFNVWLSIRMNDCHGSHEDTFLYRCDEIYYTAKRNGWFIGDHNSGRYFGECVDYAQEYVREKMLSVIRSTVEKYDSYGVELDFLREAQCFDLEKDDDRLGIMTEFMTNVRAILDEIGERRGHKIKLLVRLPRDIGNCRIFGFDVKEWVKRGLVDVISPCSRWLTTDSDMPIGEWCELVKGSDVTVTAGLEFYLYDRIEIGDDCMRGFAAQYVDEGSDGMYLYNFYREFVELPDMTEWMKAHPGFELYRDDSESKIGSDKMEAVWNSLDLGAIDRNKIAPWEICSDPKSSGMGTRRHVMTYMEDCMCPKGGTPYRPLPITVTGEARLEKLTGNIEGREAYLYLGLKGESMPTEVTVDGNTAELVGKTEDAYVLNPKAAEALPKYKALTYVSYRIAPNSDNRRDICIKANGAEIEYLEIKVESIK